jgi:hypothetical protein
MKNALVVVEPECLAGEMIFIEAEVLVHAEDRALLSRVARRNKKVA